MKKSDDIAPPRLPKRASSAALAAIGDQEIYAGLLLFDKCDLRGAKLAGAKLVGADLRSSRIDGARAGIRELQGAIVNSEQAIAIARLMGVDVRLD